MQKKILLLVTFLIATMTLPAAAAEFRHLQPGKHEKCPVCGMFVYKYPDWAAQVEFADQTAFYFDGVKDLFKYMFNLDKYNPGKTVDDIQAIRVTDYYDMAGIDGRSAHYVVGSDITGPMGHELIPFKTRADAEAFLTDHMGRQVLSFTEVTPYVIRRLDP